MKLGLGLYRRMLTADNFRFARQAGCTHIVAHLVDYFQDADKRGLTGSDGEKCWGSAGAGEIWPQEELDGLVAAARAEGLEIAAIENFDPAFWHDVLLDGPQRDRQVEGIRTIIRRAGKAGIPVIGYNFSIAGVWGHVEGPWARGQAKSVAFLGAEGPEQTPIPNGQVWNMVYNPKASPGSVGTVTSEQLWDRLTRFLKDVLPVVAWPCTRTTRRCRPSAAPPAWSTNPGSTTRFWTSAAARPTPWSSASAPSRRCPKGTCTRPWTPSAA